MRSVCFAEDGGQSDMGLTLSYFMKICFTSFMKPAEATDTGDEHLQIQVPAITKRDLGQRSLDQREPIRMIVLRALRAYGVIVPEKAIYDRRKQR
jgi:hypothetical protein